jgi:hypothetical protein
MAAIRRLSPSSPAEILPPAALDGVQRVDARQEQLVEQAAGAPAVDGGGRLGHLAVAQVPLRQQRERAGELGQVRRPLLHVAVGPQPRRLGDRDGPAEQSLRPRLLAPGVGQRRRPPQRDVVRRRRGPLALLQVQRLAVEFRRLLQPSVQLVEQRQVVERARQQRRPLAPVGRLDRPPGLPRVGASAVEQRIQGDVMAGRRHQGGVPDAEPLGLLQGARRLDAGVAGALLGAEDAGLGHVEGEQDGGVRLLEAEERLAGAGARLAGAAEVALGLVQQRDVEPQPTQLLVQFQPAGGGDALAVALDRRGVVARERQAPSLQRE